MTNYPTDEEVKDAIMEIDEAMNKISQAQYHITQAQNLLCQDNPGHGLFYEPCNKVKGTLSITKYFLNRMDYTVKTWSEER